ncbi:MAG TPA: mucoidy inhibitor MuiA family protein, partial [Sandaracinaceae bacterium LLY-WYZ-13_1]|nr:mucoidy inhibitor MuiA family protein [Sandaracinaceae bacterium LLY-WYZ-13_1]
MSEVTEVPSRVDAVTVHRAGAQVTRVAELEGAPARIRIGPLPLDLDDGSVRVSVRGEDAPAAVDLRVILDVPEPDGEHPPARPEDVADAEQRVAELRDRRQQIRVERSRVEGIGVVARPSPEPGEEPPPSPAEARLALLELRDERLTALDADDDRVAGALREAERRLAELRDRERRASSARRVEPHELRKAVVISLRGGGAAARLELTYRVDAARWAPSYVLRLERGLTRGTLEVRAVVAQRTGEDWDGVALALSTATLHGWAERPELASIRIGRRQPPPARRGWRPPPADTEALFADYDRAA